MKIVVKESIIDACERIRKEAEAMNYAYDAQKYATYRASKQSQEFRGVHETIDIEHIEVNDNDQKLLQP